VWVEACQRRMEQAAAWYVRLFSTTTGPMSAPGRGFAPAGGNWGNWGGGLHRGGGANAGCHRQVTAVLAAGGGRMRSHCAPDDCRGGHHRVLGARCVGTTALGGAQGAVSGSAFAFIHVHGHSDGRQCAYSTALQLGVTSPLVSTVLAATDCCDATTACIRLNSSA
jgi:hypothetical protein